MNQHSTNSQCPACNAMVVGESPRCAQCGAIQPNFNYRSRIAAAALAVFAGMFGAHRFYLGQWWGVFYLLFFWTYIPWLVGLIEGVVILSTSQQRWNEKYNRGVSAGSEKGALVVSLVMIVPVIAVLGIMLAVAIPAYQDYVNQTILAETLQRSAPVRAAIEDFAVVERAWASDADGIDTTYLLASPHVSGVRIEQGTIDIVMSSEGLDGSLILTPSIANSEIIWRCSASTIHTSSLPAACRE